MLICNLSWVVNLRVIYANGISFRVTTKANPTSINTNAPTTFTYIQTHYLFAKLINMHVPIFHAYDVYNIYKMCIYVFFLNCLLYATHV